jgi:5'-3' exonuclease
VYSAQPGNNGRERVESARAITVQSLQRALRECQPTHAAGVFDGEGLSWRHHVYTGYKADRPPMPEALQLSLTDFRAAFLELGVTSLTFPTLEADDIIGILANKVALRNGNVIILSTDKIFIQLLSERIKVRDHFQKKDMNPTDVIKKFGVKPKQFVDFLSLSGDNTNNIIGVPTVGPKTAAKLLNEYGNLENILLAADTLKGKLGETLSNHTEEARMAQSLFRLRDDIELGLNLKQLRYKI